MIVPQKSCIIAALVRSCEHVVFDRTYSVDSNILEFFVPTGQEQEFLAIIELLTQRNLLSNVTKLPNRIKQGQSI